MRSEHHRQRVAWYVVLAAAMLLCRSSRPGGSPCGAAPGSEASSDRPFMLNFAGHRNRASVRLLKDPKLKDYFAPNFVWDIRVFQDRDEFFRMTQALRAANPQAILGSYTSGFYALSAKKDTYPPAKLPLEECQTNWLLRAEPKGEFLTAGEEQDRFCLDMRLGEVRAAVISTAVRRALENGLDSICFDNCYWGVTPRQNFVVPVREWTAAYMAFFAEAGSAAHEAGLLCVVNVATTAPGIPRAFRAIAPHVDGIMSEMAFHRQTRTPEALYAELKGYEDVLKQGKIVLVVPRYKEDEQFGLLAIRPLARKYGRIYLATAGPVHYEPLYRMAEVELNCDESENN